MELAVRFDGFVDLPPTQGRPGLAVEDGHGAAVELGPSAAVLACGNAIWPDRVTARLVRRGIGVESSGIVGTDGA
jgi:hypothetical protein